jgi:pimeloyl-ACP methyl ester carboxylesterase
MNDNGRGSEFVDIEHGGQRVCVEHAWIGRDRGRSPLIVFLHEGLGSLAIWKDFPRRLCDAAGCRGLVYSRPGYGRSTPHDRNEVWAPDFLHQQAVEVLPALLQALDIDVQARPPWLFGHSDGGSIALLYAARFPLHLAGAIVAAPHIMVEDITIANIEKAREQTGKDHPVQIYLLQAQLAAYRDYQVALFRLNNGAVVPADNPARVRANAELKELQGLLNAQKVKQTEELISYWVELCALDR